MVKSIICKLFPPELLLYFVNFNEIWSGFILFIFIVGTLWDCLWANSDNIVTTQTQCLLDRFLVTSYYILQSIYLAWYLQNIKRIALFVHSLLQQCEHNLTLIQLFTTTPTFANSVDPDQMASEEAIWSGSTLLVIQFVNLNENIIWCNLIGW